MSAASEDSGIEQVRTVLFGAERDALSNLGKRVDDLAALGNMVEQHHAALQPLPEVVERINQHQAALQPMPELLEQINQQLLQLREQQDGLSEQLVNLEALVGSTDGRTDAVSEVLVDAVSAVGEDVGVLGGALRPEVEHAVFSSARTDSAVLAEALYPVMGPAIRKMIANLFNAGTDGSELFIVSELLLIERTSGVLLASSTSSSTAEGNDSDIVSGMLDAIRLFVEEAFDSPEHDGLRDLRVGDTSVLVEWGPKAILASVIKGVPTPEYRDAAALTLERIHLTHADALANFDGRVQVFAPASTALDELRNGATPKRTIVKSHPVAFAVAVVVLLVLLILLLVFVVF